MSDKCIIDSAEKAKCCFAPFSDLNVMSVVEQQEFLSAIDYTFLTTHPTLM